MRYVESLNQALHDLIASDDRVYLIGQDVLDPYGGAFKVAKGLSTRFPDRVITTPVSEAAMVGLGTGLALRGFRPIVELMFGDFVLLAADQIVNSAAKFPMMFNGQVTVPLVIRVPMGARRGYGPTHSQTIETFFLNTPGLDIVAPSHVHDPGRILRTVVERSGGVTLFVENKSLYATELLSADDPESMWHVRLVPEATGYETAHVTLNGVDEADVVLIAYGGMAPIALEAAYQAFMEDEVAVACLFPSQIKPLPWQTILDVVAATPRLLVAEESVEYAGWGAELTARLSTSRRRVDVTRVGAREFVIPSAKELESQVVPGPRDLVRAIRQLTDAG